MNILMGLCGLPLPLDPGTVGHCMQRYLGGFYFIDVKANPTDNLDPITELVSSGSHGIVKPDLNPKNLKSPSCTDLTSHSMNMFTDMLSAEDNSTSVEDEPYMYCIRPILDPFVASEILV